MRQACVNDDQCWQAGTPCMPDSVLAKALAWAIEWSGPARSSSFDSSDAMRGGEEPQPTTAHGIFSMHAEQKPCAEPLHAERKADMARKPKLSPATRARLTARAARKAEKT